MEFIISKNLFNKEYFALFKKRLSNLILALLNTDVFYRLGSSCSRRRSQQSHHQEVESQNGLEKFGGILQILFSFATFFLVQHNFEKFFVEYKVIEKFISALDSDFSLFQSLVFSKMFLSFHLKFYTSCIHGLVKSCLALN